MYGDPGLFLDLALHGFFDRLTRFDEACQSGIEAFRPAMLPPHEHASLMLGKHDDDRIDTREMLGIAGAAAACPARLLRNGARSAHRAEGMAAMPMNQAPRRAVQGDLVSRDFRDDGAAARAGGEIAAHFLSEAGKDRALLFIQAEQQVIFKAGVRRDRFHQQMAVLRHRVQPVEHQASRVGRGKRLRREIRVHANVVGTVQAAANIAKLVRGHGHLSPSSLPTPRGGTRLAAPHPPTGRAATIRLRREACFPLPHGRHGWSRPARNG